MNIDISDSPDKSVLLIDEEKRESHMLLEKDSFRRKAFIEKSFVATRYNSEYETKELLDRFRSKGDGKER